MVNNVLVKEPLGKSDHAVLSFIFQCYHIQERAKKTKYNFNKGNYECMREKIKSIEWDDILKHMDVEQSWSEITRQILEAEDKFITKKTERKGIRKLIWMNEKAITKIRKKKEAFRRYLDTKEGKDYTTYTEARNQAKWETRKTHQSFQKKIAKEAKLNPKAFFRYANSKLKVKSGISDLKNDKGEKISDDGLKAEALNNFFSSVFTVEDTTNMPTFEDHTCRS